MKSVRVTFIVQLENGAPDARSPVFHPTDTIEEIQSIKFRLYRTNSGGEKYIPADEKQYKLWLEALKAVEI